VFFVVPYGKMNFVLAQLVYGQELAYGNIHKAAPVRRDRAERQSGSRRLALPVLFPS
jgi:hypothetical protein